MKKTLYAIIIRETNNPKLLKNFLDFVIDMLKEFNSVEFVKKKVEKFKTKNKLELKGLDPWF